MARGRGRGRVCVRVRVRACVRVRARVVVGVGVGVGVGLLARLERVAVVDELAYKGLAGACEAGERGRLDVGR